MPPNEADSACLWDMLEAAQAVLRFIADRDFDDYLADEILQSAIERKIEIIGEAARKISNDFKQSHPEFPWTRIIGQHNILAHEYGDIDHKIVWKVIKVYVPELIALLDGAMPSIPEESEI
jgi:uncharacterized protein with HEPN domain